MIADRFSRARTGRMGLPKLKGRVKITLHNPKTGKNEIIEAENLVTNAIYDIFANNIMGGLDYNALTPIWSKWFGGVLAFEQAHTLNADNYYPQADTDNHLFAHAGDVAPSTAEIVQEDLTRGAPSRTVMTSNSVMQAWEFSPSQGNSGDRYIRSLALTHKDVGNVGLGNSSSAFAAFVPFETINGGQLSAIRPSLDGDINTFAQYDSHHGLAFYIGTEGEYKSGKTKFSTQNVTCYIKRTGYQEVGLFDKADPVTTDLRKFTVATSVTFYNQPSFYFNSANKKLWLFTNYTSVSTFSESTINYTVIDCESGTEDSHGTITKLENSEKLAPTSWDRTSGNSYNEPNFYNIVKNGDYFYFYITTRAFSDWNMNSSDGNPYNGFKKVNITNLADQEDILFNSTIYRPRGGMPCGGLTLHDGSLVNGSSAFKCGMSFPYGMFQYPSAVLNSPDDISSCLLPFGNSDQDANRRIVVPKTLCTTLFNLPSPAQKTSAQSMSIEYTLTEASEES